MTRVHRALGSSSLVLFLFAFLIPTGNPATVAAALGTKQVPGDWCHPIAARTSVAMNPSDPDYVTATGLAAFGDSGSGATVGGKALGVLVSIGISSASIGNVFITRLPPQVARAERMLGTQLTLQTAPRR